MGGTTFSHSRLSLSLSSYWDVVMRTQMLTKFGPVGAQTCARSAMTRLQLERSLCNVLGLSYAPDGKLVLEPRIKVAQEQKKKKGRGGYH